MSDVRQFSYHERQKLDYGTKKQRLGADSIKALTACALCLHAATAPLVCAQGHLYCTECIYSSLLSQKRAIQAQQAKFDKAAINREIDAEEDADAAQRAAVDAFKRQEANLNSAMAVKHNEIAAVHVPVRSDERNRLLKRKRIDDAEQRKVEDSSPWLQVPSASEPVAAPQSSVPVCPAGEHALRRKQLIKVEFKRRQGVDLSDDAPYECPVCLKALRNGMQVSILKNCAHAMCSTCAQTLTDRQCFVCSKKFKKRHIVQLHDPGTGYAGSNAKLDGKKNGIAFVC